MEQETIIYYYLMPEQMAGAKSKCAARRHWFQEAALETADITGRTRFHVLGCAIPPFYYRRRPWKAQKLSETMETVLGDAAGMVDTCIHPAVGGLLTEEYSRRWTPRESTVRLLVKQLLEEYAGKPVERCDTVTVLLGNPADTDRQMQATWELLQPFLPRINRMLIYYERQEKEQEEASGLQAYLEDYYYEYGLVPQPEPYVKSRTTGEEAARARQTGGAEPTWLKCGRAKCGGMILDYCGQFRYPKILPGSGIYIDAASAPEKEQMLRRKGLPLPYLSPLKYLDTMVKNSYDGLVKKGTEII